MRLETPENVMAIHVDQLHKLYRDVEAVSGLSFHVNRGEIWGLVGPNGAGKTTTLRAISGIIAPTKGTIRVAGYDIAADAIAAKQRLAHVPDDPKLFDTLTVWEHLQFTAKSYNVSDIVSSGEELLARFELTEKRDALAQELSRGMRQKLAVCCAYIHDPEVILFDEPLAGLDPRGIRIMKQSIKEQAARGVAIVISSHMLALVEDLCSHLLILQRGRRVFSGPILEARQTYGDLAADASLEDVFFRATEGEEAVLDAPADEG